MVARPSLYAILYAAALSDNAFVIAAAVGLGATLATVVAWRVTVVQSYC